MSLTVRRTVIQLGDISVDAYTDGDKNYLSGRGMSESIGLTHFTTVQKHIPKALKTILGAGFTMVGGSYKMASGGLVKVSLWDTESAAKYYIYHASKGNAKAFAIVCALVSTTLDIVINDAFGKAYQKGDAAKIASGRILDRPCPYQSLYSKEVCEKGFKWFGSSFYWTYFYYWMNAEERAKHERLNPVINGRRKQRIHQWLEESTRDRLRDKAIELKVLILQSNSKQAFESNFRATYGSGWQMSLF